MVCNLFYRRVSTAEIALMTVPELRYWNEWHELIAEAEKPDA